MSEIVMPREERERWRKMLLDLYNTDSKYDSMFYQGANGNIVVRRDGQISNMDTGHINKMFSNTDKYLMINVNQRGKGRRCTMSSRVIAETFFPYLGRGNYFYEVNHIDGDKNNNTIENLEWLTRRENLDHARSSGLFKSGNNRKIQLEEYKDVLEFIESGVLYKEVARLYGVDGSTITKIVKRAKEQRNEQHN
jgi:hypothetical protein